MLTRNTMIDIQGDFKNIRFTMDKTFSMMSGYNQGWETLSNCKIIRRELLLYNSGICFDYYPISYRFFLYLFSGNFFLILIEAIFALMIINWFLCILERELTGDYVDPNEKNEDEEEEEPLNDDKQKGEESKDHKDSVNDTEQIDFKITPLKK